MPKYICPICNDRVESINEDAILYKSPEPEGRKRYLKVSVAQHGYHGSRDVNCKKCRIGALKGALAQYE